MQPNESLANDSGLPQGLAGQPTRRQDHRLVRADGPIRGRRARRRRQSGRVRSAGPGGIARPGCRLSRAFCRPRRQPVPPSRPGTTTPSLGANRPRRSPAWRFPTPLARREPRHPPRKLADPGINPPDHRDRRSRQPRRGHPAQDADVTPRGWNTTRPDRRARRGSAHRRAQGVSSPCYGATPARSPTSLPAYTPSR
jgi:hypothetical protein